MAIVNDVRVGGAKTSGATSLSFTATVNAGLTNSALVVTATTGAVAPTPVSTVAWDTAGVNEGLTQRGLGVADSNCNAEIFYKLSPTAGASKTILVTASGSCEITAGAAVYQYVNQAAPWFNASPVTATGTVSGSTPQPSATVPGAANGMFIAVAFVNENSTNDTLAPDAGLTSIYHQEVGAGNHSGAAADAPGATSQAMSFTGVSTTNKWGVIADMLVWDGTGGGGGGGGSAPRPVARLVGGRQRHRPSMPSRRHVMLPPPLPRGSLIASGTGQSLSASRASVSGAVSAAGTGTALSPSSAIAAGASIALGTGTTTSQSLSAGRGIWATPPRASTYVLGDRRPAPVRRRSHVLFLNAVVSGSASSMIATGTGLALSVTRAVAAGAASALGSGRALSATAARGAGSLTASGTGVALSTSVAPGSSSSVVTAVGSGSSLALSVASGTGAAIAAGIGASTSPSTARAPGAATAMGVARAMGVSVVGGAGAAIASGVGLGASLALSAGVGAAVALGLGISLAISRLLGTSGTGFVSPSNHPPTRFYPDDISIRFYPDDTEGTSE